MSAVPDGVGYIEVDDELTGQLLSMNSWPFEDSVVGRFDVKNAKFCDNVV